MSEGETLDILGQIHALVSDKLQVVSYKWLSRNLLVSSNHAKRLLLEFVDKNGNDLEVVYTLSGWSKNNPQAYCIRLASGLNLAGVKQEFQDNCSVQVYSVQACIPKDLSVLWSAEFVQAQELFNQPAENCLRDNRFCGVSNSFVKRTVDAKPVSAAPSQQKNNTGVSVQAKSNSSLKDPSVQPPQQGQVGQSSAKHGMQSSTVATAGDKIDKIAPEVSEQTSKPHFVKESIAAVQTNKRKGQNERASSGSGGSIASLWDRVSAKSKPPSPAIDTTSEVPNVSFTAEAQIYAHEAADAACTDDDGHDINCKRESNGASSRKRRMVIDSSDDEEENVVSLASPDPPNGEHVPDLLCNTGKSIVEKKNLNFEEQKTVLLEVKQDKIKERNSGMSLEDDARGGNKNACAGISLRKKTQSDIPNGLTDKNGDRNGKDRATSSTSPRRKKVLNTRIDERGREVTKVVWEGQTADSNTDKNMTAGDGESRPPMANKAQAMASSAPTNPVSKVGNKKPAKGGGKDAKQGNILSFFKKV